MFCRSNLYQSVGIPRNLPCPEKFVVAHRENGSEKLEARETFSCFLILECGIFLTKETKSPELLHFTLARGIL